MKFRLKLWIIPGRATQNKYVHKHDKQINTYMNKNNMLDASFWSFLFFSATVIPDPCITLYC